jgi:hypothetical protein
MELSFPEFEKELSRRINEVEDFVFRFMRRKVQEQLNEWASKYQRHNFTAWDDYGMLILEINPPLQEEGTYNMTTKIQFASERHEIRNQARDLIDYWNSLDEIKPYLRKMLVGRG